MMPTHESRHISICIERPWAEVNAFLGEPLHFNRWASGLGNTLRHENGRWLGEGPGGPLELRVSAPNAFGIIDHWVLLPDGGEVYAPMRVLANGDGAEVIFTLLRLPGMSEEQFAGDADWVARDLASLKRILEA